MSKRPDSLEEFTPFFGGDQKGPQMVQALFEGTDYTNKSEKQGALLKQLLRAENYRNFQSYRNNATGQSMLPDDVPPDVANVVTTAALFARAIDFPSGTGSFYNGVYDKISKEMNQFLNRNIASFRAGELADMNSAANSSATVLAAYKPDLNNRTVGDLYLIGMADRAAWDAHTKYGIPRIAQLESIDELNKIIECDTTHTPKGERTPVRTLANMCLNSTSGDVVRPITEFVTNANKNALPSKQITSENVKQAIQHAMRLALEQVMDQMKIDIMSTYKNNIREDGRPANKVGQFSRATVIDFMNALTIPNYRKMIDDNLKKEIQNELGKFITLKTNISHTTLRQDIATKFADDVFRNWSAMGNESRQFYIENIALFGRTAQWWKKTTSDNRDQTNKNSDWVQLTNEEIESAFDNPSGALVSPNFEPSPPRIIHDATNERSEMGGHRYLPG